MKYIHRYEVEWWLQEFAKRHPNFPLYIGIVAVAISTLSLIVAALVVAR